MAETVVFEETGHNEPAVVPDEGAAPDSLTDAELADAILGAEKVTDTPGKQADAVVPAVVPAVPADTVTKEEFDKLKKKMENQELFIQRQGTEVGTLRKLRDQLTALAKEKRALAEEQLLTNPSQAMDTHADARDIEKQAANTGIQEQFEANRAAIQTAFPDFESRIDDIVAASLEMGIPEANLENFRRNPYGTPIEVLTPYVRAAVIRKHYFDKAALVDKLTTQVKALETGTSTFTKKLKDAALTTPVIKAAGGGTTEGTLGSIDESQIPDMSYAEIERLLKVK